MDYAIFESSLVRESFQLTFYPQTSMDGVRRGLEELENCEKDAV